ncbi:hypothetical protein DYU05_00140 [Mucilaginibacter terrenus]|uniref:Uncharacterized protein n=1 Tax=Mucilaginibacter terrenus TaxID=2482727 RepID=A0A3E2NST5_9SPHI|nr:hypothetical protein [Mucilaginibacter terrenus]RFZ84085.1 hypothetical protein DYU05_00140 [Mucilaginibacter terrenus]
MSEANYPTEGPDGTIPVQDGVNWTTNWRTYLDQSDNDFHIQYFNIPIVDFQNILTFNPGAESVRAYIGLTDATDPMTAKLILVPVVDGHDVIVVHPDLGGGVAGDGQSNIYDMTQACPPNCPANDSIMYA